MLKLHSTSIGPVCVICAQRVPRVAGVQRVPHEAGVQHVLARGLIEQPLAQRLQQPLP
jgi:hypothetical protein